LAVNGMHSKAGEAVNYHHTEIPIMAQNDILGKVCPITCPEGSEGE
jgi:hypothetical protein